MRVRQSLISLVATLVIMGLLLFGTAGTLNWPLGWWFGAIFLACTLLAVVVIWRVNPEIFVARSRIQPGTKAWDYFFIALIIGGFMAVLPVAGLDFRFGWSSMPGWVIGLGFRAVRSRLCRIDLAGRGEPALRAGRAHPDGPRTDRDRHRPVRHRPSSRL